MKIFKLLNGIEGLLSQVSKKQNCKLISLLSLQTYPLYVYVDDSNDRIFIQNMCWYNVHSLETFRTHVRHPKS